MNWVNWETVKKPLDRYKETFHGKAGAFGKDELGFGSG